MIPVAADFVALLLDMTKTPTGVALWFISMLTITHHVSWLSTVVTVLLALTAGSLAFLGNVAAFATVVAC